MLFSLENISNSTMFMFLKDIISIYFTNQYIVIITTIVALATTIYNFRTKFNSVYLIDFSCYRPPNQLRVPPATFIEHIELSAEHDREAIDLQTKVIKRSCIGGESCVPLPVRELPPTISLKLSREENETVLFEIIQNLFSKHNIDPKNIDILVSNCSLFCPTPSITSTIINKFGFRSDVKSVNLSGMGCSAGLLSISLAKDLLKIHKNSTVLVLSMEVITPNGYRGNNKSMLLANVLFRMGGAAILLSNKKYYKKRAKYELKHLVRTHSGSSDQAYNSVFQDADEKGNIGVSLSKSLLKVAATSLKINISQLAPLVLPYSEQLKYGLLMIFRKFWNHKYVYVPNFKKAFSHFCIHAGGKAVIDAVEDNLRLSKFDTEASRMTLYRFGNTSSSSVWYELCYLEAKGRVKRGDQVWQIAFGSGFKCNSAVWKCVNEPEPKAENAWLDRIHLYPVEVMEMSD